MNSPVWNLHVLTAECSRQPCFMAPEGNLSIYFPPHLWWNNWSGPWHGQIGFIEFVVAPLALAMAETPGVWWLRCCHRDTVCSFKMFQLGWWWWWWRRRQIWLLYLIYIYTHTFYSCMYVLYIYTYLMHIFIHILNVYILYYIILYYIILYYIISYYIILYYIVLYCIILYCIIIYYIILYYIILYYIILYYIIL